MLEQLETPPDLVLLDLVMPGMSGQETLAAMRELLPQVRVVIASGYIPAEEREAPDGAVAAYLDKPFLPEKMLQVVRQVLDSA